MTTQKHKHIAYNRLPATDSSKPSVIFCGGFRSDMTGSKAIFLEELCSELGLGYLRFDYSGHGESEHKFEDGCISDWRTDTLLALDELTKGPQILIGSSMGGWLGLHAALARPERIKAFIGIAAAPDFTDDMIWDKLDDFSREKILRDGLLQMPNCEPGEEPYPITLKLIEDGRKNFLLREPLNINCPIRLLHGMADEDVPYNVAMKIADKVTSDDVEIHLVKKATHRMSDENELNLLRETLISLI